MTTVFIAKCEQCGVIERGSREEVGDAVEEHDHWHDVKVKRAATDGGQSPGPEPTTGDHPTTNQTTGNSSPDVNRLAFERDLAVRQARISKAGLQVVKMALEENRPLEALRQVNDELDRLDDEMEPLEHIQNLGGGGGSNE